MYERGPDKQHTQSDIPSMRPLYLLPDEPFIREVLIPSFASGKAVDCMMGFFSSEVLASLAPGLATFINCSNGIFRLIISPILRTEDLEAMKRGINSAEDVAQDLLDDLFVTEDFVEQHALKCLTWLIRARRIEIRIGLMNDALFHPKVWLFTGQDGEMISAHGSSNLTTAGLRKNIEQVAVSTSWGSPEQRYTTGKLRDQFLSLWANRVDSCIVVELPSAIKQRLLSTYAADNPPTETDLLSGYQRATERIMESPAAYETSESIFAIPSYLQYESGPFAHQGDAVRAWCEAGNNGVLEMATGSGKTITAMICANKLYETHKPLLIVVAAPYVPLIEQWCDEIKEFGVTPANITRAPGAHGRADELGKLRRGFRSGTTDVAVVVVSHSTLSNSGFQAELKRFDCTSLLIADEAHNLGSGGFINSPPEFFDYRLGLSATPVRQYDETGTESLFAFLGPVVYRYTLEDAIGNCLVEYDYHVHPVSLTQDEMNQWYDLTTRIKQNSWREENGQPDDFLTKLLRDRRTILENAENKISALWECLNRENLRSLCHTLIYASDKAPKQLEAVNTMLNDLGVLFHQVTYEETAHRDETRRILELFTEGALRVLTAKRVLDEGVNIPQVQRAYILASTTVERQWVQRRGRLLRKCGEIGKTHSVIHDFVALPPDVGDIDPDARTLVRSELVRIQEFARLARNAGQSDGPLQVMDELVRAAYL